MKKILCIYYRPPYKNGPSISSGQYNFYQIFKQYFEVSGISFTTSNKPFDNFELIKVRRKWFKKTLCFLLLGRSPRLTHFKSADFRQKFKNILNQFDPDYIYVEHVVMMQYLIGMGTKAKVILFNDDSFSYSYKNKLNGSVFQKLRNKGLPKFELEAIKRADFTLTITNEEKLFLEEMGFRNVFSIPYGIDIEYFTYCWEIPQNLSLLYVGNFDHYPNREAVKFLAKRIYPNISKLDIRVRIVGRNLNRIKSIIHPDFEIHEDVEDIRKYYCEATFLIAPIFSGAGLRIKILEAAACGIPILLTPLANLGIGFNKNEAFGVDNISKETFATNVLEIVSNFNILTEEKLKNMSQLARRKIEYQFSNKASQNRIENFIVNYLK